MFSRDGKKEGFIFLQHINTLSTQTGILVTVCVPRKRGERQLGNLFSTLVNQNTLLVLNTSSKKLTEEVFSFLTKGVIAYCGMVPASFSYHMSEENHASPTTDQCTVFSWRRLKFSTRGEETWAISVLELRWKSCCHILTTMET